MGIRRELRVGLRGGLREGVRGGLREGLCGVFYGVLCGELHGYWTARTHKRTKGKKMNLAYVGIEIGDYVMVSALESVRIFVPDSVSESVDDFVWVSLRASVNFRLQRPIREERSQG